MSAAFGQTAGTGRGTSVATKALSAGYVRRKKALKLFGVKLSDWLVCTKCSRQQVTHAFNGDVIDDKCWNCNAARSHFCYFDEHVATLPDTATVHRLVRPCDA